MENPTSLYDVKFTFAEPDNKLAKPQIQINNYIFCNRNLLYFY